MKKMLMMAGGTGGHVIPGLTVAEAFQEKGYTVEWLGTKSGIESTLVPQANIPIHYLNVKALRGKGWRRWLMAPFTLFQALWQAITILRKTKPDWVIGMGGYASGPGGIAAGLLRIPLAIHEQNSVLGMTNRMLSYVSTLTFEAFPNTFPKARSALFIGNPVRSSMLHAPVPAVRFQNPERVQGRLRLLVLGGSLGAKAINELVPETLRLLPSTRMPHVWHQVGQQHLEASEALYAALDIPVKITPFIQDMASAYEWADVVIARAGALTVSELTAIGVASILIPYPHAVDDHQTKNAEFLVADGAAILLPQSKATKETLAALLHGFIDDPQKKITMAEAARKLAWRDATDRIVEACLSTRMEAAFERKSV